MPGSSCNSPWQFFSPGSNINKGKKTTWFAEAANWKEILSYEHHRSMANHLFSLPGYFTRKQIVHPVAIGCKRIGHEQLAAICLHVPYRTRSPAHPNFERLLKEKEKNHSSFTMYPGKDTFAVTSIMAERAMQEFTVQLDLIDSLQRPGNSKLPPSDKKVFLYMKDSTSYTLNEPHTIPLKNIRLIR